MYNRLMSFETSEHSKEVVNQAIADAGLDKKRLAEINFPEIRESNEVEYAIYGPEDAEKWLLMGPTHLTPFRKPHFQLRALVTQLGLGDEFAVLAVDHYPNQAVDAMTRAKIAQGDYSYMSDRFTQAVDAVLRKKRVELFASGYSLSADGLIQFVHDAEHNPNRGIVPVVGLFAVEFARSVERGPLETVMNMLGSGESMPQMIFDTGIPSIDDAWKVGAKRDNPKKYKASIQATSTIGAVPYLLGVDRPNWSIICASGTDVSTKQLEEIKDTPVIIGKATGSTMCRSSLFTRPDDELPLNISRFKMHGDHGSGDQTRNDAARVRDFVTTVSSSKV